MECMRLIEHLKGAIVSDNSTILVNAALCEGLSDQACLEMNESFNRQARKLNKVYQSTGYLKVLVLCVRFSKPRQSFVADN
jgi:hypothetical protein